MPVLLPHHTVQQGPDFLADQLAAAGHAGRHRQQGRWVRRRADVRVLPVVSHPASPAAGPIHRANRSVHERSHRWLAQCHLRQPHGTHHHHHCPPQRHASNRTGIVIGLYSLQLSLGSRKRVLTWRNTVPCAEVQHANGHDEHGTAHDIDYGAAPTRGPRCLRRRAVRWCGVKFFEIHGRSAAVRVRTAAVLPDQDPQTPR
mmetsp:Transcript_23558/g.46022  ORF Transcript_23558/g.46022 Transcript_23558/m.46022 type:complete len:201 (+) Transcript_23558:84-686(+)